MGIIENAREVFDLARKLDNAELQQRVLDLQNEALKLTEEIGKLQQENEQLREQLAFKDTLVFEDDVYWSEDAEDRRTGPWTVPWASPPSRSSRPSRIPVRAPRSTSGTSGPS